MPYATYHNHTTFCDGQSTAEEMTQAAVAAGCSQLVPTNDWAARLYTSSG